MAREFAKSFYKSAAWQRMREFILIRDHYKCVRCGGANALEVHHIEHLTPDNINDSLVTLNDRNLITLCRDCHFKEHEADKLNGRASSDCEDEFYFDEDGFIRKR